MAELCSLPAEWDTPLLARLRRPLTDGGLVSLALVRRIQREIEWWRARRSLATELLRRRGVHPGFDQGQRPIVHAHSLQGQGVERPEAEPARPVVQALLVPSRAAEGNGALSQSLQRSMQERVRAAEREVASPPRPAALGEPPPTFGESAEAPAVPILRVAERPPGAQLPTPELFVALAPVARPRALRSLEAERLVVRPAAWPSLSEVRPSLSKAPPAEQGLRVQAARRPVSLRVEVPAALQAQAEVGRQRAPSTTPLRGAASEELAAAPLQLALPPRVQPRTTPGRAPSMVYAASGVGAPPTPPALRALAAPAARPAENAVPSPRGAPMPVQPPPAPRLDLDELADKVQRRLIRQLAQERARRGYPR